MDEAEDFQKKFPEETKRRLGVLVDKFDKVKETMKVDKFRNIIYCCRTEMEMLQWRSLHHGLI